MQSPIVLNFYDENNELVKTCTRTFVPWKMLKKAIALQKRIGKKEVDDYEVEDMDALTNYIMEMYSGQEITLEMVDEMTDVTEMMNVVKAVLNKAKGVMDPTLPSRAS